MPHEHSAIINSICVTIHPTNPPFPTKKKANPQKELRLLTSLPCSYSYIKRLRAKMKFSRRRAASERHLPF